MAITTVEDVKAFLDIPVLDTSKDFKIGKFIPMVEADYSLLRNAPWDLDADGNILYPVGSDVVAIMMVEYQLVLSANKGKGTINSESIDNYSVSYGNNQQGSGGYPSSITNKIMRFIRGDILMTQDTIPIPTP